MDVPTTGKKIADKIRFIYEKDKDFKEIYVNGAYGGMNPRGELIVNFFFERTTIPKEERMPLVAGKTQDERVVRTDIVSHDPSELVMIRNIKATIIIPVQEVNTIANWMLDRVKESGIVVEKKQ